MSYLIKEYERGQHHSITLVNDPMFKVANWIMNYTPSGESTIIKMLIEFKLRPKFLFLNPIIFLMRKALLGDLTYLKAAIEENDSYAD